MSAASRNVKRFAKRWTGAGPDSTVVSNYRGSVLYIGALREVLAERRDYRRAAQQKEALRWAESTRADKAEAMLKEVDSELARVKEQKATDDAIRLPAEEEEQVAGAAKAVQGFFDNGGEMPYQDAVQVLLKAAAMLPVRTEERRRAARELTNANRRTAEVYEDVEAIHQLLPEDYRQPGRTVVDDVEDYIQAQDARLTEQDLQLAEQATKTGEQYAQLDRELAAERSAHIHTKNQLAEANRILREVGIQVPEQFKTPGIAEHIWVGELAASWNATQKLLRNTAAQIPERFKNGNGADLPDWTRRLKEAWQTAARQPHPDRLAADLQQGVNAVNNLLEAVREVVRKNG